MQSDRAEEQAPWEQTFAEWKRLSEDHMPKRLACLQSEVRLAPLQGDIIHHRLLARDDFRARHMGEVHLVVDIPGGRVGAEVSLSCPCIGQPHTQEVAPGKVVAERVRLQYVAILDRDRSWRNPEPTPTRELWILRHERGHFDLTELYARQLHRGAAEDIARVRGEGATVPGALADLWTRWAEHFAAARKGFEDLETRYDRETAHGTIPKVRTRWFERIQRELARTRAEVR